MNDNLMKLLNSLTDLPEEQVYKLLSMMRETFLKKGECFIQEGQIPKKLAFVNSGLFRYYYMDIKGNEFTKGFFPENTFLSAYSSLIQGKPSYFTIEALEDANILMFTYEDWKTLLHEHIGWNKLLIAILEKAFIKKETREKEFLLFDAEKRYTLFLQEYPGLDQRVKQHLVASYLGITSVALSRIRKKMGLVNIG